MIYTDSAKKPRTDGDKIGQWKEKESSDECQMFRWQTLMLNTTSIFWLVNCGGLFIYTTVIQRLHFFPKEVEANYNYVAYRSN